MTQTPVYGVDVVTVQFSDFGLEVLSLAEFCRHRLFLRIEATLFS